MNVTQVGKEDELKGDRLDLIFQHQAEVRCRFRDVERSNGIHCPDDVDLNAVRDQDHLKSMGMRVILELVEALDCITQLPESIDIDHLKEELADALHFLAEIFVDVKVSADEALSLLEIPVSTAIDKLGVLFEESSHDTDPGLNWYTLMDLHTLYVIRDMTKSLECLKNKPWKVSNVLTDVNRMKYLLAVSLKSFVRLCIVAGMNADELFSYYMRKNKVNHWRIDTKY